MEIFNELAAIVFIVTAVSVVMKLLKQPLIVGYILAGILAGPFFFNVIHSTEFIDILSKMGIAILLFIVGLHMSPKVIKEVGKASVLTGVGQVVVTTIIGYFIAIALGFGTIPALYIAIGLTFSSTIIVLKLLSDKGDLNKLYGKISIGFLLMQDIIASIVLIVISSLSTSTGMSMQLSIAVVLLKAIQVGIILYLLTIYVLPRFMKFIANSQELLFLFSISWGLALSSVFYIYGFSSEIGALLAGVTLSVTPYAYEIGSRLKPLRDFFIVLFFVLVGSHLKLDTIPHILVPAIILSLYVLIGNPIIMMIIMHVLGYQRKTSYMSGLIVSQISEFSLILAAIGFSLKHLSQDELSLITLVGLITIAGSTYFMLYAEAMYPFVEKWIKKFEFIASKHEGHSQEESYEIVLFGFDRVGNDFINTFKKLDKNYLVVDFNPHLIEKMKAENIPFKYGDASNIEFLQELPFAELEMCVSTIPDFETSSLLLKRIRHVNKSAIVIMLSHDIQTANELYAQGATYVILPHYLSAKHTAHMIDKLGFDHKEFKEEKQKHLAYIKERQHNTAI